MPYAAMIRAFLAATITSLYVNRQVAQLCDWTHGYYKPLNQKAWEECNGVQISYTFKVMIALPYHAVT